MLQELFGAQLEVHSSTFSHSASCVTTLELFIVCDSVEQEGRPSLPYSNSAEVELTHSRGSSFSQFSHSSMNEKKEKYHFANTGGRKIVLDISSKVLFIYAL